MNIIIKSLITALALVAPLAVTVPSSAAVAACVSGSEYQAIHRGQTKAKVHAIVKNQKPLAARNTSETYDGCDGQVVAIQYQGGKVVSKKKGLVSVSRSASPQSQAIAMAYDYLDTMPFSKAGLSGQLQYEGFSRPVADYAVNHIRVSWRVQSVRMARSYLRTMPFSCSGLIDQLVYEEFSYPIAVYGANHTNAC